MWHAGFSGRSTGGSRATSTESLLVPPDGHLGTILAAIDWATILPSLTMKVSDPSS